MGDAVLAKFMRKRKVPAPVERIVSVDWLATVHNQETLNTPISGKRVVHLACGHYIVTKNRNKAPCPACHKMILDGEDYDAFRNIR